jgi:hypothetical protein
MVVAAMTVALAAGTANAALEMATAEIQQVSSTGSGANKIFNYALTLNDTGPTKIGTLWYSWIPGLDFLATAPTNVTAPTGWTDSVITEFTGDGYSIQWVSSSPTFSLTPGQTLTGFNFSSPQTLTQVTSALSTILPLYSGGQSYVYIAGPETDSGFSLVAQAVVPEPASMGLVAASMAAVLARRRRSPVA